VADEPLSISVAAALDCADAETLDPLVWPDEVAALRVLAAEVRRLRESADG